MSMSLYHVIIRSFMGLANSHSHSLFSYTYNTLVEMETLTRLQSFREAAIKQKLSLDRMTTLVATISRAERDC